MQTWGRIATITFLLVLGFAFTVTHGLNMWAAGGAAMAFTVKSSAFASGAEIPRKYTCSGTDVSPALEWTAPAAHTASFALIMDDPNAPAGTWVHWVLWGLPATARTLPEGTPKRDELGDGARQGCNDFNK